MDRHAKLTIFVTGKFIASVWTSLVSLVDLLLTNQFFLTGSQPPGRYSIDENVWPNADVGDLPTRLQFHDWEFTKTARRNDATW